MTNQFILLQRIANREWLFLKMINQVKKFPYFRLSFHELNIYFPHLQDHSTIYIKNKLNMSQLKKSGAQLVEDRKTQPPTNKSGIIAGIALLCYEIIIMFLYGFLFSYSNSTFESTEENGGMLLVSIMGLMLVVGFGLMNSYVLKSSATGLIYTMLAVVLTLQHYFLFRAFWNRAGTNLPSSEQDFSAERYDNITFSNYFTDLQTSYVLTSASFVDAIACCLSILVALNTVIGRVGVFQVFILSIFGSFLYEVNSQLLWRLYISDNGYGARIFIYGSILGWVSSLILGRQETTEKHRNYKSSYEHMTMSFVGFVLAFCSFPMLTEAGVYSHTSTDNFIIYTVSVNTWLSLTSSVLGFFVISSLLYTKLAISDLIFCGLSGAIAFTICSDIHFSPAVPLVVGFSLGLVSCIYTSAWLRKQNKQGVVYTFSHFQRFFIPSLFGVFIAAILHGGDDWKHGGYNLEYRHPDRSATGQGAFQLIAIPLSIGIGALAGVIVGFIYRVVNSFEYKDQYNDKTVLQEVPKMKTL